MGQIFVAFSEYLHFRQAIKIKFEIDKNQPRDLETSTIKSRCIGQGVTIILVQFFDHKCQDKSSVIQSKNH